MTRDLLSRRTAAPSRALKESRDHGLSATVIILNRSAIDDDFGVNRSGNGHCAAAAAGDDGTVGPLSGTLTAENIPQYVSEIFVAARVADQAETGLSSGIEGGLHRTVPRVVGAAAARQCRIR